MLFFKKSLFSTIKSKNMIKNKIIINKINDSVKLRKVDKEVTTFLKCFDNLSNINELKHSIWNNTFFVNNCIYYSNPEGVVFDIADQIKIVKLLMFIKFFKSTDKVSKINNSMNYIVRSKLKDYVGLEDIKDIYDFYNKYRVLSIKDNSSNSISSQILNPSDISLREISYLACYFIVNSNKDIMFFIDKLYFLNALSSLPSFSNTCFNKIIPLLFSLPKEQAFDILQNKDLVQFLNKGMPSYVKNNIEISSIHKILSLLTNQNNFNISNTENSSYEDKIRCDFMNLYVKIQMKDIFLYLNKIQFTSEIPDNMKFYISDMKNIDEMTLLSNTSSQIRKEEYIKENKGRFLFYFNNINYLSCLRYFNTSVEVTNQYNEENLKVLKTIKNDFLDRFLHEMNSLNSLYKQIHIDILSFIYKKFAYSSIKASPVLKDLLSKYENILLLDVNSNLNPLQKENVNGLLQSSMIEYILIRLKLFSNEIDYMKVILNKNKSDLDDILLLIDEYLLKIIHEKEDKSEFSLSKITTLIYNLLLYSDVIISYENLLTKIFSLIKVMLKLVNMMEDSNFLKYYKKILLIKYSYENIFLILLNTNNHLYTKHQSDIENINDELSELINNNYLNYNSYQVEGLYSQEKFNSFLYNPFISNNLHKNCNSLSIKTAIETYMSSKYSENYKMLGENIEYLHSYKADFLIKNNKIIEIIGPFQMVVDLNSSSLDVVPNEYTRKYKLKQSVSKLNKFKLISVPYEELYFSIIPKNYEGNQINLNLVDVIKKYI